MGENDDEQAAEESIYLHGDLDLTIIRARDLPNMDLSSQRLRRCISALNFRKHSDSKQTADQYPLRSRVVSKSITSDPYVKVCLAGACVARTQVKTNSQNPEWNEQFHIPLVHRVSQVEFHVKDHDMFGADHIGIAKVSAMEIAFGEKIEGWVEVIGSSGKTTKPAILLEMKFTPCDKNPVYSKGVDRDLELKQSYFPMRPGGRVTLYQDAHVTDGVLPEIELDDNTYFVHNKCWEDICHTILEARHMVYLMGWSIYDKVRLVRESTKELPRIGESTLGELLKHKSREGVRVLLLVWDDRTSQRKVYLKTKGVMATHDEETRKFFKHSSVICTLAPRYASDKLSFIKQHVVGTIYSHHQKCVIVDTQGSDNKRRITAFIGGLDLTDGRYDTPEHRLFHYKDVFKGDYCNKNFPSGVMTPREPWHDLHCKIEGAAAYDVLTNFAQRWKRATDWIFGKQFKKTSPWRDDALIDIEHISWITSPPKNGEVIDPSLRVCKEDDTENWHVQVFRSIDSGSAKGFPKDPHAAAKRNLVFEKHMAIDRSIQMAYIQAIRSAQHFIYIENQYFIGSSYAWDSKENLGANNRIPMELALKITSKIRAEERFSVYVVIPMWPEGDPKSTSIQQILYWQCMTMQMMYKIIAEELKTCNLKDAHPYDYLNFYCLGNREKPPEVLNTNGDLSSLERTTKRRSLGCFASDVKESDSYANGRFMVYVHSKGMIVDDEYVILGSANINQRSMAGSRDTEIAMGAYQPHHTWAKKAKHPHGQVYGYRMSLWAEHLGRIDDCFKDPEKLDCVKKVNSVAEGNWKRYIAEEFKEPLEGHILKYPIQVEEDGEVSYMPEHESFPDVGGKILGSSSNLPYPLTT